MQEHYTPKGKHLTIGERRLIEQWKNENKSNRQIANLLAKAPQTNRRKSVKKLLLTKDIKQKILHYHQQKISPEMMVKTKQLPVGISTIYYWIHNGHLGLTEKDILYPRKVKAAKKKASPNFKPAGKSIEERPEFINLRLENGHYEIDTVILTKVKNHCLLVLTDRRSRHQIIRLIPNKSAGAVNQALKLILKEYRILS